MSSISNTSKIETTSIAPLYGDAEILLNLSTTMFWADVFSKNKPVRITIVKEAMRLNVAMLSWSTRVFFRYRHGSRTAGLILSTLTAMLMIGLNSKGVFWIFKPFYTYASPVLFFTNNKNDWMETVTGNVHSHAMIYFIAGFALLSFLHTICIYCGFGNKYSASKRGSSWLYRYIFSRTRVSEYHVQAIIEPALIVLAALALYGYGDRLLAFFLMASALCTFLMEVKDNTYRHRLKL